MEAPENPRLRRFRFAFGVAMIAFSLAMGIAERVWIRPLAFGIMGLPWVMMGVAPAGRPLTRAVPATMAIAGGLGLILNAFIIWTRVRHHG